jgi:hypothetical protein
MLERDTKTLPRRPICSEVGCHLALIAQTPLPSFILRSLQALHRDPGNPEPAGEIYGERLSVTCCKRQLATLVSPHGTQD